MKKLQLTFNTADGKRRNLALNYIKEDLGADTTKSAMDKIIQSEIFQKEGLKLFAEVVGAKYIDRQEFPVFSPNIKNS